MSHFVSGYLALAPPSPPLVPSPQHCFPDVQFNSFPTDRCALLSERLEQANLLFEWLSKSYQKENVSNPFSQQFHRIMCAVIQFYQVLLLRVSLHSL